jgi:hypothetical protein
MTNKEVFREFLIRQALVDLYIRRSQRDFYAALRKADVVLLDVAIAAVDNLSGVQTTRTGQAIAEELKERLIAGRRNQLDPIIRKFLADLRQLATDQIGFDARLAMEAVEEPVIEFDREEEDLDAFPMNGRTFDEWWALFFAGDADRIMSAVNQGVLSGDDATELYRNLRGTASLRYADGVTRTSFLSLGTLIPTLIAGTISYGNTVFAEANDFVQKERYTAIRDSRTTILCASLDGGVYNVGEGPHPPMHRNCRSFRVPIFEGAGDTEPVDTNYEDWLKNQPVEVQNAVLGNTKAVLFREGNLALRDMLRRDGTPLTLTELQVKQSEMFKRLGIKL